VTVHTASAGTESDDPEFCCNTAPVGAPALGTRWYHFVATHTSARLSTCGSVEPEEPDSLLQVFEARNARSPELACATLTPIGCSDDSDRCSPDTGNADLCLGNLKIGRTYYVLVAAKTECARGNYTLTLTAPCSPADRTCPREGPRRNNRR